MGFVAAAPALNLDLTGFHDMGCEDAHWRVVNQTDVTGWSGGVPLGILVSGGSQHSMWKPRSHESQNNMFSWGGRGAVGIGVKGTQIK